MKKPTPTIKKISFPTTTVTMTVSFCKTHGETVFRRMTSNSDDFACEKCLDYLDQHTKTCELYKNLVNLPLEEALVPKDAL